MDRSFCCEQRRRSAAVGDYVGAAVIGAARASAAIVRCGAAGAAVDLDIRRSDGTNPDLEKLDRRVRAIMPHRPTSKRIGLACFT